LIGYPENLLATTKTIRISLGGILLGAAALLLAIVHFWAGPFSPQPSLERTVAETAVAIRDATVAAMRGDEIEEQRIVSKYDLDKKLEILAAVLGGCAIIAGVVAFAMGEPTRAAAGAAALGAGAIAFKFAVIALGAVVLAILIGAVISQLDFF